MLFYLRAIWIAKSSVIVPVARVSSTMTLCVTAGVILAQPDQAAESIRKLPFQGFWASNAPLE